VGTMHEADFPILARRIHGKRLVYLDSAATAQKPRMVIEAVSDFTANSNANIHRGLYTLAEESTAMYEEARGRVARFINAPVSQIVFTGGATDAINLVASSWGRMHLRPGDEILLTPLEHHANIVPWQEAAKRAGAKVVFCGLNDDLTLDNEDLLFRIGPHTKMLAITQASNVLGIAPPLREIILYAKSRGVTVLIDGAQGVAHAPVDVLSLGCDFYAFSGHKLLGPTGIGVLYLSEAHSSMEPYRTGGEMIDDVTEQGAEYAPRSPRRFEAGTPDIMGAIGLGAAISYLDSVGMEAVRAHGEALLRHAWQKLSEIPGVTLYGPAPDADPNIRGRAPIIAFDVAGVPPHDVAQLLDAEGVCVRSGKLCAHPLLARMGVPAINRASFHLYNNESDIEALCAAIRNAQEVFR
jgi:cysteine desulfurase / selenocysteine lyase